MYRLMILSLFSLLTISCSQYGKVSFSESPKVINVSEYDPKERQRAGRSYSHLNQHALKANGSLGLIARIAKGTHTDAKCASFLKGAEQAEMMLGTYYYVLPRTSAQWQADNYISQLKKIKASYPFRTSKVLLVADFDTNLSVQQMTTFLRRVKQLTGVTPVVYLENSEKIRATLKRASHSDKAFLRQHPYWLALYSRTHPKYKTPQQLTRGSSVWKTWAMWQYGGVWWKNGRSKPYHYQGGPWNTPKYFGNLAHPLERNGFNGSKEDLLAFWDKHSWHW